MTYAEKLQSPKWQRKRLEILNRDDFKCTLCGDTEDTLHVHHKEYRKGKQPWEYEDENFITLCKLCHKVIEHLKEAEVVPLFAKKTNSETCPNLWRVYTISNFKKGHIIFIHDYDTLTNKLDCSFLFDRAIDNINELLYKARNK